MSGAEDSKNHFKGQDSPHSKNMSGAEDRKSTSRDKQPALESNTKGLLTERILQGKSCPHSKNMSGAEDPKEQFKGQAART
jgi:hypothetical protein